ncbi:nuclear transport factor 2 family protein [Anaeromyxobacter oryzisoli]|uniref:nuclear transport factor 2 family protein n=1 Tax=Anaeromyxobacter oryzisoli TaxID=2925408 RepID=UPI001F56C7EC|nr:nuclear transport factor 2 family protein [Anaeromyxobacter sp. SG63]
MGPRRLRRRGGGAASGAKLGAPYLVPAALAAAAAVLLWLGWGRLAAVDLPVAAASPETQVREALRHQDRAQLADVYGFRSGGTVELYPVHYPEIAVHVDEGDEGGRAAHVLALVEGRGRVTWRDERAELAYIGREAFDMTRCSIALWCGDGRQLEQLRGVLATLFRREDAFNGRDARAYERLVSERYRGEGGQAALLARLRADLADGPRARVRIRAWQIRVERDRAEVGEDYDLDVAGRPTARLRARYVLAREGERWAIVDGL